MLPSIKNNYMWVAIVVATAFFCSCASVKGDYTTIDGKALGTFVQIKYSGLTASDRVVEMIKRVDQEAKASMSIFDDSSLLQRINRSETDSLDSLIMRNIAIAKRFTLLSDGAYDITLRPLTEAWGFAGKANDGTMPNIDSLMEFVGADKIEVVEGRLHKSDYRVQLDFNSIAKGYTVDLMAEELERMGIEDYMVNIGGEIRCRGLNSRGTEWSIGVETPYDGNFTSDSFEKILQISDGAMATSGNYRRFYHTDDGRKVVHTIDPRTGYSVVSNLLSATVIATTCAEADAAATMFMAIGDEQKTLKLAAEVEKMYGWRYYFIFADGDNYRIECSEEFK